MNFDIIWRYFSWANQTLAMIALWTGAMYLWKQYPGSWKHYIAVIPAIFMTMVTFTYILQAPEGFGLSTSITYPADYNCLFSGLSFISKLLYLKNNNQNARITL